MKFTAYSRTQQGTGASRRLRHAAKVPGIVYGTGTPTMVELDHNALFFALKKEAFHSSILEMELTSPSGPVHEKVVLRAFQMHAYKPMVMHIDFQRVDEQTRLRKKVPLHFSGEENSPAVKTDKCVITHVASEVEIECLAAQLPEFVEIDLSNLAKNTSLHASDLKLPEGLKVVKRGTQNPVIVAVANPKAEEEVETVATAVVAPADKSKAKPKKTEKQNQK